MFIVINEIWLTISSKHVPELSLWPSSKFTFSKGRLDQFMIAEDNNQLVSHFQRKDFPKDFGVVKKLEMVFLLYFWDHSKVRVARWSRG